MELLSNRYSSDVMLDGRPSSLGPTWKIVIIQTSVNVGTTLTVGLNTIICN